MSRSPVQPAAALDAPATPEPPAGSTLSMWRLVSGARLAHAEWLDAARSLASTNTRLDLIYVDPPFNTGRDQTDRGGSYPDRFASTAAYIAWLDERIRASIPLLTRSASILLHVDWRTSHRVRVMLDEILGEDHFVNHLIWSYGLGGSSPRRFARKHDDILFYAVDPLRYWFQPPRVPATSVRMRGKTKKATDVLTIPHDVLDVPSINNMAAERAGYPTQKPLALLDLLVRACSPPSGVVWDPCCGSGTTAIAAAHAGRVAIASDVSADAIAITRARLNRLGPPVSGSLTEPPSI